LLDIAAYRKAREEAGFDPETGVVTTAVHTFVGDSDVEVNALVEKPMKQYLSQFVKATNDDKNISGNNERVVSADEKEILLQAVLMTCLRSGPCSESQSSKMNSFCNGCRFMVVYPMRFLKTGR
jgi:hypothetical protein